MHYSHNKFKDKSISFCRGISDRDSHWDDDDVDDDEDDPTCLPKQSYAKVSDTKALEV